MSEDEANSLTVARRVDARCDEFEHALAIGLPRSIESFLVGLEGEDRQTLLLELLGIEIDARLARQERPVISDYSHRFPELSVERISSILENARLSDDALVDELSKQGYTLARRTVTKYRKALNIPSSRERRAY